MKAMIKIAFDWLMSNPIIALLGIIAIGYGVVRFQDWRIDNLKDDNKELTAIIENERDHNGKVVEAFEDKGMKDNERETFKREATAAVAATPGRVAPSPALLAAYKRVYERNASRGAK